MQMQLSAVESSSVYNVLFMLCGSCGEDVESNLPTLSFLSSVFPWFQTNFNTREVLVQGILFLSVLLFDHEPRWKVNKTASNRFVV